MQALGMIETKGLIAATESADAMLKSANVKLLEKVIVGGGLVAVTVTGSVSAVNAAVEAGGAAVKKLGESLLISQHVIPRPDKEIKHLITEEQEQQEEQEEQKQEEVKVIEEEKTVKEEIKIEEVETLKEEIKIEEVETLKDKDPIVKEEVEPEIVKQEEVIKPEEVKEEKLKESVKNSKGLDHGKLNNKESVDKAILEYGLDETIESLKGVTVAKLRKLTREYKDFGIKSAKISRANKSLLIGEIKKYYENK